MFNNHKLAFRNILIRAGFYSRPDFMIVGAQKAATSTLFHILARHPCILAPRNKELNFFDGEKIPFGEYNAYQMHFPLLWRKWRGKQTFEASPEYLYNRHVASRIYYYNKKTKIIVILRNPIERAYSAWNMYANPLRKINHVTAEYRSFDEAVEEELKSIHVTNCFSDPFGYLKRGIYHRQLKIYDRYFQRPEQLCVLFYEELFTEESSKALEQFLGIQNLKLDQKIRSNKGGYSEAMSDKTRDRLQNLYAQPNAELARYLNRDLPW